jgi:hypothetical protein
MAREETSGSMIRQAAKIFVLNLIFGGVICPLFVSAPLVLLLGVGALVLSLFDMKAYAFAAAQ